MHIPVLLKEVISYLEPARGEKYIDATIGAGGHTREILAAGGRVLGIDQDLETIERLQQTFAREIAKKQLVLTVGNFAELENLASQNGFLEAAGALFDLGLSSEQLDDAERGFAFQREGPLDMRFSRQGELTAHQIVNFYPEGRLREIFFKLGEERRFAKKVAGAILEVRKSQTLETTTELFNLIKKALPGKFRFRAGDTARRIFMGLRIAVNEELGNLERALPQALKSLKAQGRLVGISFHSLEDRLVKNFLVQEAKDCVCPPEFPICRCDHRATLRILTKKPITPSEEEIKTNPRAHSAKLRAAEKI